MTIIIVDVSPSSETRYPRRNIPRRRYDEMEVPDEDDYIRKFKLSNIQIDNISAYCLPYNDMLKFASDCSL